MTHILYVHYYIYCIYIIYNINVDYIYISEYNIEQKWMNDFVLLYKIVNWTIFSGLHMA